MYGNFVGLLCIAIEYITVKSGSFAINVSANSNNKTGEKIPVNLSQTILQSKLLPIIFIVVYFSVLKIKILWIYFLRSFLNVDSFHVNKMCVYAMLMFVCLRLPRDILIAFVSVSAPNKRNEHTYTHAHRPKHKTDRF